MSKKKRETFTNSSGFVLSCIGAAVGLGNIWMFPYKMGQNGGAVFLIPYFLCVILLGTTGLIAEFAFGRANQGGAFKSIKSSFTEKKLKLGSLFGITPAIGLVGIFVFYNIVVGWIMKYFTMSLTGEINKVNIPTFFDGFAGSSETVVWTLLAMLMAALIIGFGAVKGIEKVNNIIMPGLFLIFIALAVRSLTLPGAMDGVKYLLTPRWEYLFKANTWVMAMGQAFFSVSLNGCGMMVYGSYMKKEFDIPKIAFTTAILDSVAALLAAFVIMPAAFAFGLDPAAGPQLLFVTVPTIFEKMPAGRILAIFFFLSMIFAAFSSAVNMLEGSVESFMTQLKSKRKNTALIIAFISFIIAIPLSLSMNLFDNFTNFVTIVLSPLGALITFSVFFYIFDKKRAMDEINLGASLKLGEGFRLFGKYGFVFITILIIILGVMYGGIG